MAYSRDTEVELKGTFRDADEALADPTEVTLYVLPPSGTLETYTWVADAEVTHVSTGIFTRDAVLNASGPWYYRFKGTGDLVVAGWKRIDVIDDPLD